VHGQINLSCVDCHADLQGKDLPHDDKLAKPVCSACHEDAVKAYDQERPRELAAQIRRQPRRLVQRLPRGA
jgi:NAD-dependent SIR2 family protein deacetylase